MSDIKKETLLEAQFLKYRKNIIGINTDCEFIYGRKNIVYADWVASGRLYGPIEDVMRDTIGPMIANPHSFSSETGKASTYCYNHARTLIKKHVNANNDDVLVTTGTGMTAALSKLQRIMGLRSGNSQILKNENSDERPVVFITHMEHHSNQVPWYETIADVVILPADENNLVSPLILEKELEKYSKRNLKIGSFTACSNVTGIITPYHQLAKIMHQNGGYCFVDFAASAPYEKIDMHPNDLEMQLDAIFFSPHKFLGGPGTCGILVFNKKLYNADFPDNPGGGNVKCTDPWGGFYYNDSLEVKEDGGTPGFLQVIRTALCLGLKDQMGVENIKKREKELLEICFSEFEKITEISILGDLESERIGCVSFVVEGIHYNLIVRLLNDYYGIQVRGGWSCASTYAHNLFGINKEKSKEITCGILAKDLKIKPGWVRLSLHPTMTNEELLYICDAVKSVIQNIEELVMSYKYNPETNEFENQLVQETIENDVKHWFDLK
ncbi:aminotransferase class V-fold PLP-dependent enzyme [Flavobacterium adhaerens]|uniref:aminotransferase class V-fold PLP-dependent enzyme n=1 Tax=Flavobacterium adhaerens TaxID=3149043 RepID=UPI0032B5A2D0